MAPALPLAQAIGRWGNYFNQELYGRPTDLPWALEIDAEHLPADRVTRPGTTFHPTFLYESLWNFALCGLLLWIDRRYRPAGGRLLAMYVLGYGVGRFWVEGLRIDAADELGGLRWNQWVSIALIVGGGLYLLATIHKPKDPVLPPIVHGAPAADGTWSPRPDETTTTRRSSRLTSSTRPTSMRTTRPRSTRSRSPTIVVDESMRGRRRRCRRGRRRATARTLNLSGRW